MKQKTYYGKFGGCFVSETLVPVLEELEENYIRMQKDAEFQKTLAYYLREYAGRPSPLYYAEQLTKRLGGAKIYLKREDLNHTGSHKINNTIGQVLLAKKMGKTRVIAETGAGQHGVATATAAAMLGLDCEVFMGKKDAERQALNLYRMKLLGARVNIVKSGSQTLKDAINEALGDYVTNCGNTHYVIGSVVGPHPYPLIVRDFQSVIGKEAREQIMKAEGRLPDCLIACIGGGSNAIGLFYPFAGDNVKFIGVEAAGKGLNTGKHSASLCAGEKGVLHGCLSYFLQDSQGQIAETHSIAAGLDYPGVGPEHSLLKECGRAEYAAVTDNEAVRAFKLLARTEGIIPALESAHAIAYAEKYAPKLGSEKIIVINLSGRGDKDAQQLNK